MMKRSCKRKWVETRTCVLPNGKSLWQITTCNYNSLPAPLIKARRPDGYWTDPENQREFLNQLAQRIDVKDYEDWYEVPAAEVKKRGGSALLSRYSTMEALLRAVYPAVSWDSRRFIEAGRTRPPSAVPQGFWTQKANKLDALIRAEKELGIKQPEEWYTVTMTDLKELAGGFPRGMSRVELAELLSERYPSHSWDRFYLLRGRYAQQNRLQRALKHLFPNEEIKTNARKEAGLINAETGDYLELDVYLPSLHLAFEYQERHHYESTDYVTEPLDRLQARDATKKGLAASRGITLITIPYWWDGTNESLAATIAKFRPELRIDISHLKEGSIAIPDQKPADFKERSKSHVEDIGEPMTASFLARSNVDPTHWWIFEKYDGIRGFWNPLKKAFYTRLGTKLAMPQHIIDAMPPENFLDGELWFGRDSFQEAMKLTYTGRDGKPEVNWDKFKYIVFDIPNHSGTYKERYATLQDLLANNAVAEVAAKEECVDMAHLEKFLNDVLDKGGEGIILRDPYAPYTPGRSPSYLKHKKFRDAEARIVDTKSAHQWECEMPNGIRFTAPAGTIEFKNRWQPQVGDIVSFKHRGFLLGSNKPKLPLLYRVRRDITWDTLLQNWKEKTPTPSTPPIRKANRKKPRGYWRDINNRRQFFLNVASEKGFDPYKSENWVNISTAQIKTKGRGLLALYNNSLKAALEATFPDLDIDKSNKWKEANVLREFFDGYAKEKGFNPLDPDSWYSFNLEKLHTQKGGYAVSSQNGGFKKALQKAYPEITFDRWVNKQRKDKT